MRTGPRRKGKESAAKESKKSGKQRTIWDNTKVSKKEAKALDRSKTVRMLNDWLRRVDRLLKVLLTWFVMPGQRRRRSNPAP